MNYEDMSDFEINKAVAKAIGMAVQEEFEVNLGFTPAYHEKYPNNVWAAECDEFGVQIEAWEQFCPCNCADDSRVIMLDNRISTINISGTAQWFACVDVRFETICMSPDGSDNGVSCFDSSLNIYHTNPLRAAMIVFLMMKGQS